ncbi:MAG: hypothetical protein ABIE22_04470 [archaeon]
MGALEQVQQMQSQGYADQDIMNYLQEQGVSPREISDAISQSQIKAAVSSDEAVQDSVMQNMQQPTNPGVQDYSSGDPQAMQPSMMGQQAPNQFPTPGQDQYAQQPTPGQDQYPQQPNSQNQYQEAYPPTPQAYPQDQYGGYDQYQYQQYSGGGPDTETVTEISEQVVAEKISEIKKAIGNIADFKAISETKLRDMDSRVKRIEKIIDNLQDSIIDKIGTFGKAVDSLRSEMDATQESFSKVVSPLIDKVRTSKKAAPRKKKK